MLSFDPEVQQNIDRWLNGSYDEETKQAIRKKMDNGEKEELSDAFYTEMKFGTGGIRGIMGVGPNRVNKYTFGKATQGFSNFLNKRHPDKQISVAIAHDCRNHSHELARVVADVFSANGIQVHLFNELRPTPELSFAVRELHCQGGVMLTASHNPAAYNGYKAYDANGCQLVPPQDQQVMEEVQAINHIDKVQFEGDDALINEMGEDIDEKYLEALAKLSIAGDAIKRQADLSIVYSPLHGAGGVMVPPALKRFGFNNVHPVEEQMVFDGDFPTVEKPNPEEKDAMRLALEKARDIDAELVMATDPDADRVGIAVKNTDDEWILLNGNQTGVLLIHYMLNAREKADKLSGNEYIVKTIVTTYLMDAIAEHYGVNCYNTLTGFKYIGEMITEREDEEQFIAGGEESYGYLIGELVRDKDAIISSSMIAEMTAFYKDNGSSLYEALLAIYQQYGCYREKLVSKYERGQDGAQKIKQMMKDYRQNPPEALDGEKVTTIKDYKTQKTNHLNSDKEEDIHLPQSNVLQFLTENNTLLSVRPSGTEPKIKYYCSVNTELEDRDDFDKLTHKLDDKMDRIIDELTG